MTEFNFIKAKIGGPVLTAGLTGFFDPDLDKVSARPEPSIQTACSNELCLFLRVASEGGQEFKKVVIGDIQFFGIKETGDDTFVEAGDTDDISLLEAILS